MISPDVGLGLGAFLMMLGVAWQCRLSGQRMSAEEGVKDGRLTEDQATRAIRFHACAGPVLIVLGAFALIASWVGFAR